MSRPKAPRPKARWKVEYEVKVAAMSNTALLNEVIDTSMTLGHDYIDRDDKYGANTAHAELIRRLTFRGFLPPAPTPGKPPRQPGETDAMYWSRTTPRSQGGDGV